MLRPRAELHPAMPDLSVVIVNFRTRENLRITLSSVFGSETKYSYEVFVVDNDSRDGSAEMVEREFPTVKLIRSANNGFSKANNKALRQASGRTLLILNPDTKLSSDVIQSCVDYLSFHPDIGALSCKVLLGNGTLDKASRRRFPSPLNAFYRFSGLALLFPKSEKLATYNLTFLPDDQATDVDAISGCFMLIPRRVLDEVGHFDERFFMYGEDLDLCLRINRAGYRIYYYPAVAITHYKRQSSKKAPLKSLWYFHDAMWMFYRKHYADRHTMLFNFLVRTGIAARFGTLCIINAVRR